MKLRFRELHNLTDALSNFEQIQQLLSPNQTILVAGTVSVAWPQITANNRIMLSRATAGGTLGQLSYVITPGTGFVINSSSATDTSSVNYQVL